ncbi:MAG: DEAD/DEAH box helicase [Cryomorphaceae bacterium]|nr:DEAD/DEAH box helicase [Cryomorphaceae bacterium]
MSIIFSLQNHEILEKIPVAYWVDEKTGYVVRQIHSHHLDELSISENIEPLQRCFALIEKLELPYFLGHLNISSDKLKTFLSKEKNKPQVDYLLEKRKGRIAKLLEIIARENLAFGKDVMRDEPVDKMRCVYAPDTSLQAFFVKAENNITYRLQLMVYGKKVFLLGKDLRILVNSPAWCVVDNLLLHIPDAKASFLLPFTKKETVNIPERSFDNYLEKFIAPMTERDALDIFTDGLETQRIDRPEKTILTIEKHILTGKWGCHFAHKYGPKKIDPDLQKNQFSRIIEEGGIRKIQQIIRNHEVEAAHQSLVNTGTPLEGSFKVFKNQNLQDIRFWIDDFRNKKHPEIELKRWTFKGKSVNMSKAKFNVSTGEGSMDWFDVEIVIVVGDYEIAFATLAETIKNGWDFLKLPNGEMFLIPEAWKARAERLYNHGVKSRKGIKIHRSLEHLLEEYPKEIPITLPEKLTLIHPNSFSYRTYQMQAIAQMLHVFSRQKGFLLADEMGLGKTLQVLGLVAALHHAEIIKTGSKKIRQSLQLSLFDEPMTSGDDRFSPALIVVPPALSINWQREVQKFFPQLKSVIHAGPNRADSVDDLSDYHLIIVSYHTLRSDVQVFSKTHFPLVVFDESQLVKNPQSQIYHAVKKLYAEFFIALSGTPVENSLNDLWSVFSILQPEIFGKQEVFAANYRNPIERESNEDALAQLKLTLGPFLLRRTKNMVAKDLPELDLQVVYSEMDAEQDRAYEETKSKVRNIILEAKDGDTSVKSNLNIYILNGLTKLRQIANHPKMVGEEGGSGKHDQLINDITQICQSGKKALVFSSFTVYLDLIEESLESIPTLKYTGSMSANRRQQAVDEFSNSEEGMVLLMSLKAGGVGLNLTAADYVLLADPWWNPQAEAQAIARAHRMGRKESVTVRKYLSIDTIEEKIYQLQQKKQKLADDILQMAEDQNTKLVDADLLLELMN